MEMSINRDHLLESKLLRLSFFSCSSSDPNFTPIKIMLIVRWATCEHVIEVERIIKAKNQVYIIMNITSD